MSGRKFNDQDLAYMRSLSAAILQRSPRHSRLILWLSATFIVCIGLWMSITEIDTLVRGSGKVIPSQQLQVIQSLEGGVVSEILSREGDKVSLGQPLMKISDINFASSFEENQLRILELRAQLARLGAEAFSKPFVMPDAGNGKLAKLMDSQKSLHQSNQRQLEETLSILQEQVNQKKNELIETQAKRRQLSRSLKLIKEELAIKKPLVQKRLVSEIDLLQLKRQANEIEGELESIALSVPRVESTIAETERKLTQTRLTFQNDAKQQYNEAMGELSRISETQSSLLDRVERTTLRAPLNGTIKRMHINTIGGVIRPGQDVIELVPDKDELLIEALIRPADIASIEQGQPTRIKFTAYDFAIFGSLKGKVVFVSADTITNEDGTSHYLVRIEPEQSHIGTADEQLWIKVGMVTDVDILTGKKTLLRYLLKPLYRAADRAVGQE